MKNLLTFLSLLTAFFMNAQEIKYIDTNGVFNPKDIVYTFGNNVKLRSEPNTNSKTILKIPIAEKLTILEKSDKKMLYNGINWNWYKVKFNSEIGYVLGGLLSQDTKKIDDDIYLISLKKNKKNNLHILARLVNNGNYKEHTNSFNTADTFTIKVSDNRGVPNIKNMIYIDYMAESCGVNGGGYFLFNDGTNLIKAIELTQVGDGGYWFTEEITFPNDEGGSKNGEIYFEREKGEPVGDDYSGTKSKKETCTFQWTGKEMKLKDTLKNW